MTTCATCRYWRFPDRVRDLDFLRQHELGEDSPDWLPCLRHSQGEQTDGSRLCAVPTDPYEWVRIWTAPDFGCTQHEPRE